MVIICPHCRQRMKGPTSNAGATARCPQCSKSFVVEPPAPPPKLAPPPPPEERIVEGVPIEGVPVDMGQWQGDVQHLDNGIGMEIPAPSRRDRSAAILGGMREGHQPVDPHLNESADWYVVVSDFEMDGPFTGRQIAASIHAGKLTPQTRLQRGQTRTTVAALTEKLKKKLTEH